MSEKMNYNDVKNLSKEENTAKVAELRKQLFALNMQKEVAGIEKPHELKVIKKNIARLLTAANAL